MGRKAPRSARLGLQTSDAVGHAKSSNSAATRQGEVPAGPWWDRQKASFAPGDYGMIKQVTKNILDAPSKPRVLPMMEIKPSGVVLMEVSDAARWEEKLNNVAHCPLPIL